MFGTQRVAQNLSSVVPEPVLLKPGQLYFDELPDDSRRSKRLSSRATKKTSPLAKYKSLIDSGISPFPGHEVVRQCLSFSILKMETCVPQKSLCFDVYDERHGGIYHMVPLLLMNAGSLASPNAGRALMISKCSYFTAGHIEDTGLNFYLAALRSQQKNLLDLRVLRESDISPSNISATESDIVFELSSSSMLSASPEYTANDSSLTHTHEMRGNMISVEDDSILAALFLSVYEATSCTSGALGWLNLVSGACSLLYRWGPEKLMSGLKRFIFDCMLPIIAFNAVITREKSLLCGPEWTLWDSIPGPHSTYRSVIQELFRVAELEEETSVLFEYPFTEMIQPFALNQYADRKGAQRPRLKDQFNTIEGWKRVERLQIDLFAIETKLGSLSEQFMSAYEFRAASKNTNLPTPAALSKVMNGHHSKECCPATKSHEEWSRTHFTCLISDMVLDARDTQAVCSMDYARMVVAYLETLTAPVMYKSYTQSWQQPASSVAYEYSNRRIADSKRHFRRILKSIVPYIRFIGGAPFMCMLFSVFDPEDALPDILERGCLWSKLSEFYDTSNGYILPGLDIKKCDAERELFELLPVCDSCGGHLRPKLQHM